MARKTKTTKAKAPKKKVGKKAGVAALPRSVVVISSIPIEQQFRKKFVNALNTTLGGQPITPAYVETQGYDPVALGTVINGYAIDASVGLIVTLGGLITCQAALNPTYN